MVAELLEPPLDVDVCGLLGNVVHEKSADGSPVVSAGEEEMQV